MVLAPLLPILHPILKSTFPNCLWQGNTQNPEIALTFDDGPHPEYTPKLLEVLDKGKNIAYPRIVFDKDKDYDNRLHVPSSIRKEAKSKGYKIVTRMTADKSKFVIMREAI